MNSKPNRQVSGSNMDLLLPRRSSVSSSTKRKKLDEEEVVHSGVRIYKKGEEDKKAAIACLAVALDRGPG